MKVILATTTIATMMAVFLVIIDAVTSQSIDGAIPDASTTNDLATPKTTDAHFLDAMIQDNVDTGDGQQRRLCQSKGQ